MVPGKKTKKNWGKKIKKYSTNYMMFSFQLCPQTAGVGSRQSFEARCQECDKTWPLPLFNDSMYSEMFPRSWLRWAFRLHCLGTADSWWNWRFCLFEHPMIDDDCVIPKWHHTTTRLNGGQAHLVILAEEKCIPHEVFEHVVVFDRFTGMCSLTGWQCLTCVHSQDALQPQLPKSYWYRTFQTLGLGLGWVALYLELGTCGCSTSQIWVRTEKKSYAMGSC